MSKRLLSAALILFAFAALSTVTPAPGRKTIGPRTPDDPDALPFSGAVQVGKTVYLSGVLGLTPDRTVPDDPKEEARIALDQMKATLKEAGMTMDDLATVQIFCSDVSHYAAFNSVYRTYFEKEFPARAFIGSGRLLFDARFEIQGVAVKR